MIQSSLAGQIVSRWDTSWHNQVKVQRHRHKQLRSAEAKMARGEPLSMAEMFVWLGERKQMKVSEVLPPSGDYLKAADLDGKTPTVRISGVGLKDFDEGAKLVLSFEKATKVLALNVTNTQVLQEALGDETDNWVGHVVMLHTVPTQKGPGIRVMVPSGNGPPQAQPQRTTQLQTPEARLEKPAEPFEQPQGDGSPF